jgi:formylglycine-generating enzyme required for sulfatase activity
MRERWMSLAAAAMAFALSACPSRLETHTVSYDDNGADSGTAPLDTRAYLQGDSVTVATSGTMGKTGHAFDSWDTAVDGSGVTLLPGNTFSMRNADLVLYAQWRADPLSVVPKREMLTVPAGTFAQWTADNNHTFTHSVSSFQVAAYEVTVELWYTVRQWADEHGYSFEYGTGDPPTTGTQLPMTHVTWQDCIVWCNAYSEREGHLPVYCNAIGDVIRDSRYSNIAECDGAIPDWTADGYRLPTEGEWQYAASYQDGTSWTMRNWASGARTFCTDLWDAGPANGVVDGKDANDEVAVYGLYWALELYWAPTGVTGLADVGTKKPNQIGACDMSGNAAEWCWDWDDVWPWEAQQDYRGPAVGTERIVRGGYYAQDASWLAVGQRESHAADVAQMSRGLRVVRVP